MENEQGIKMEENEIFTSCDIKISTGINIRAKINFHIETSCQKDAIKSAQFILDHFEKQNSNSPYLKGDNVID